MQSGIVMSPKYSTLRTMDVIIGYVEVHDDVENETMKYLGEVWTERQRNERNRVNAIP